MPETYRKLESAGRRKLEEAGVEDAAYDARSLMLFVCGSDRAHWPLLMDAPVPDEQKDHPPKRTRSPPALLPEGDEPTTDAV